jgi:hypothetical protein
MKNQKNLLCLICLALFLFSGCKNFDFLHEKIANDETNLPKNLTAKMLNDFPIPANSEVIADRESVEDFSEQKRFIKLESPETVYDVSHFFIRELKKNGWTHDERNARWEINSYRIISSLKFSKETAEAEIHISFNSEKGSEIDITIREKSENIENHIPIHECAKKANRITSNDEFTLAVNCWENLSTLAEFYSEEFPKKGWKSAKQTEDSDKNEQKIVKIAFMKDTMRAVVSLVELGTDRTSVKITITQ